MTNKIEQMEEAINKAKVKYRSLDNGQRKDRLYNAIQRLESYLVERKYPDKDKRWIEIRESENICNKICLNNERKGISREISEATIDNGYLQMSELIEAVSRLAEAGDTLAIKIREYSPKLIRLTNFDDRAIDRLINRSMTEHDYNAFLNGNLPIVLSHDGEDIYLTELQSNDTWGKEELQLAGGKRK